MPRVMATLVGSGRALALLAAVILLEPPLARSGSPRDQAAAQVERPGAPTAAPPLERRFERGSRRFTLAWVEGFTVDHGQGSLGDFTFPESASWFHPQNGWVCGDLLHLRLTRRGNIGIRGDRRYVGAEYVRQGPEVYGRFLARMRPSAPPGVVASFFTSFLKFDPTYTKLLEHSEIDIEFPGTTRKVQFALHWIDVRGEQRQILKTVPLPFDAGESFHTWEIEWVPDRVVFYVDGIELHRFSDPEALVELRNPHEVKANLWHSPSVPWVGAFDDRSLPVQNVYDWFAVYRLDE